MTDAEEEETMKNLVLDIGTGYLKCGFAGDDAPRSIFKNMIGKPRADSVGLVSGSSGGDKEKVFVGEEAAANAGVLEIIYVCESGIIQSWEAFTHVVEQAIVTELRCKAEEYNVLLTEAPMNPYQNRVRMLKILFEDFHCPGAQVQIQAVLALYASGRTTGLVLDSGDGVTHTVPVYKGYGVKGGVGHAKNAGRNVSKKVLEGLRDFHALNIENESNGIEIARDIKENVCRVALNFDEELEQIKKDPSLAIEYEMKDGSTIKCRELIIQPPEVLFNPIKYGIREPSVTRILDKTIQNVNIDSRRELFKNTVLSGGTTCLKGYTERVEKEYKSIVPTNSQADVKLSVPSDRLASVFVGGSILATLSTFQPNWITLKEWEESGEEVVMRKKLF